MDTLRSYILTVVSAAVVCSLAQVLFEKDKGLSSVIKLVTGLIMTITVINPLLKGDMLNLEQYLEQISIESSSVTASGESVARDAMSACITEKTTAYILDEAARLGADIQVEVELSEDLPPVPVMVSIKGDVTPYAKKQLMQMLQKDFGIAEDNQIWI